MTSITCPLFHLQPSCTRHVLLDGENSLAIGSRDLYIGYNNPCSICESWSTITWGKLWKSLGDARQKSVKRGTQHWSGNVPTLLVWMDSSSTSSELISETGSIADSDIRDVDLDSAAVIAPAQFQEVSVQDPVEEPPAIDAGQAPTMDNLVPTPQCATFITCAHALPLASKCNHLLLASTSKVAPLLLTGPSFPPGTRAPISMLRSAASAIQSAGRCIQPMAGVPWPSQPMPYAS